jgi:hypothetical protein
VRSCRYWRTSQHAGMPGGMACIPLMCGREINGILWHLQAERSGGAVITSRCCSYYCWGDLAPGGKVCLPARGISIIRVWVLIGDHGLSLPSTPPLRSPTTGGPPLVVHMPQGYSRAAVAAAAAAYRQAMTTPVPLFHSLNLSGAPNH